MAFVEDEEVIEKILLYLQKYWFVDLKRKAWRKLTEINIVNSTKAGSEMALPFLSKYARIPPSSTGGMNGLPSPPRGEG
jgi:hypothetical protein